MTDVTPQQELAREIRSRIRTFIGRIEALERQLAAAGEAPDLDTILITTSKVTGITVTAILSPDRHGEIVEARQLFIGKARGYGYDFSVIGRALNRHRTTVMHHAEQFNHFVMNEAAFRASYDRLSRALAYPRNLKSHS